MSRILGQDVPKPVKEFLYRELNLLLVNNGVVDSEWLHSLSKWSKATQAEKASYAKWRYPKGTVFISVALGDQNTSDGVITFDDLEFNDFIFAGGNTVYSRTQNRWAEILTDADGISYSANCSKEDKEKIKAMLKPEFKAGDELEYCYDVPNGWGGGIYIGKHGELFVIWTGLKYISVTAIRKADPDAKYKIVAKELKEKYVQGCASSGIGGINAPYKRYDYFFEENGLENMLIEMAKRFDKK